MSEPIDAVLRKLVAGDAVTAADFSGFNAEDVLERVDFHGVSGQVGDLLLSFEGMSSELGTGLSARAIAAELWESEHRKIICTVLEAFESTSVSSLLIKGTGLAYSVYKRPYLRRRGDTDLMVAPSDIDRASEILTTLGAQPVPKPIRPARGSARNFLFQGSSGAVHDIDLHQALSSHPALEKLPRFEELSRTRKPLPRLSPHAWTLSAPNALIVAAFHRLKHQQSAYYTAHGQYRNANRFIWFEDIRLLSAAMSSEEWSACIETAARAGLCGAVSCGVSDCRDAIGATCPEWAFADLSKRVKNEPATQFLMSGPFGQVRMNFLATRGIRSKLHFLKDTCFPSGKYMKLNFADVRPGWLPWLYIYRGLRGMRVFKRGRWD